MPNVFDSTCITFYYLLLDLSDLEEILQAVPETGDYTPFKSKFHALAYMLVRSPRPMVRSPPSSTHANNLCRERQT